MTSKLKITVTDRAAEALREGTRDANGEIVRLSVTPHFRHDLRLGRGEAGDEVIEAAGIAIHVDPDSAKRADGIEIDFVPGQDGGFRIANPNEPPRVRVMLARELKFRLDHGEPFQLIDVRPADERDQARIASARPLDDVAAELERGDKNAAIVFHCHRGARAGRIATQYIERGFKNVYNLEGGIEAWSTIVDPSIPKY